MKHCLSEEDYDDVDYNTSHSEADSQDDNDNKNEAIEFQPKEAWHDDADNEVNDIDVVDKKNDRKSRVRKWFG